MIGNATYRDYIPTGIKPMSLFRDFLLTVYIILILSFIIAFIDTEFYKEPYIISKENLGKRNSNKWKDIKLNNDIDILNNKLNNFSPKEE